MMNFSNAQHFFTYFYRELRDNHYIKDKLSTKDAKEMYERFNSIEHKFKHFINGKQNRTFWVTGSNFDADFHETSLSLLLDFTVLRFW